MAAVEVQVGAAEGGRGDAEDGVGVLLDLRIRAIFDGDLDNVNIVYKYTVSGWYRGTL